MTRAPIRARIVAAPRYGRPALALKVEGGDLSVQLLAAGFQDGDVVALLPAADLQELRDQNTRLNGTVERLQREYDALMEGVSARKLDAANAEGTRLREEAARLDEHLQLSRSANDALVDASRRDAVELARLRTANGKQAQRLALLSREAELTSDDGTIRQPPASTAACYLAAHDDGRPDPHGEADPARAE